MQVHMVVGIDMIESESRFAKRFELRTDFRFKLLSDSRIKKELETRARETI